MRRAARRPGGRASRPGSRSALRQRVARPRAPRRTPSSTIGATSTRPEASPSRHLAAHEVLGVPLRPAPAAAARRARSSERWPRERLDLLVRSAAASSSTIVGERRCRRGARSARLVPSSASAAPLRSTSRRARRSGWRRRARGPCRPSRPARGPAATGTGRPSSVDDVDERGGPPAAAEALITVRSAFTVDALAAPDDHAVVVARPCELEHDVPSSCSKPRPSTASRTISHELVARTYSSSSRIGLGGESALDALQCATCCARPRGRLRALGEPDDAATSSRTIVEAARSAGRRCTRAE